MKNPRMVPSLPRGTYQRPDFFWRGDNQYKEPEWAEKEYIDAFRNCTVINRELNRVSSEYERAKRELLCLDEQAYNLSSALSSESKTIDYIDIHDEINAITGEIHELEDKVLDITKNSSISEITKLEGQKSEIFINIEKIRLQLEKCLKNQREASTKYHSLLTDHSWETTLYNNVKYVNLLKEKDFLKNDVKERFAKQNFANHPQPEKSSEQRLSKDQIGNLKSLYYEKYMKEKENHDVKLNLFKKQSEKRLMITGKLQIIRELLRILDCYPIDTEIYHEVYRKYLEVDGVSARAYNSHKRNSKSSTKPKPTIPNTS